MKTWILLLSLFSAQAFAMNCAEFEGDSILCDNGKPYIGKGKGKIPAKLSCSPAKDEKGALICEDGQVYTPIKGEAADPDEVEGSTEKRAD
jgi:hypothetical protein